MTFCMCVRLFDGNKHCENTGAVEIAIKHFTSILLDHAIFKLT